MMTKRLFVALEIPAIVAAALDRLDPELPGLRWLPARPLHLTLAFLGPVPDEAVPALVAALETVDSPPFPLALRGLGRFGGHGRPLVVWAGVDSPPPALYTLHEQIEARVLALGLAPGEKPFHPHVTVGRGKAVPGGRLHRFLARHAETPLGRFPVGGFTLFASVLTPEGAVHSREFHRAFPSVQSAADARVRDT